MTYDCFSFFNELDLLEIRLNVLKDVVDKFVLVEAGETHAGKPKPLYFKENVSRFAEFKDRIIYVCIEKFPEICKTDWGRENFQRNAIAEGLKNARDDDTILISDLDEIPRPEKIVKYAGTSGIKVFDQRYYAYYLNYVNVLQQYWHGTRMLSYRDFCHVFDGIDTIKNDLLPEWVNEGTTASKIRCRWLPRSRGKTTIIKDGGWHFTSLGGVQVLAEKVRSFAHQEYNPGEDKLDISALERLIKQGRGPFWEMRCYGIPLETSDLPSYILSNTEKYSPLIFPVDATYMKRTKIPRLLSTIRGKAKRFCECFAPESLRNWLHMLKVRLRERSSSAP